MIFDYSRKTNIILITIEYIYNLTYNIITINNAVPSKYIHVYIYIYTYVETEIFLGRFQIQALSRQTVPNSLRKLRQGSGSLREPFWKFFMIEFLRYGGWLPAKSQSPVDRWFIRPIIYRVSTILLVVQDFATIHSRYGDLTNKKWRVDMGKPGNNYNLVI
jgi:hypothetical protein